VNSSRTLDSESPPLPIFLNGLYSSSSTNPITVSIANCYFQNLTGPAVSAYDITGGLFYINGNSVSRVSVSACTFADISCVQTCTGGVLAVVNGGITTISGV
jgi:hypothetical protein